MSENNNKKKILVADDDPGILDSLKIMLEMVGYEVMTTVNGLSVKKMKNDFPDLLLLDIWMSGQDGGVICKYLKNQPATKHIPIIMISANTDIEKIARDTGADDFLEKPFEMTELLDKVERYIK